MEKFYLISIDPYLLLLCFQKGGGHLTAHLARSFCIRSAEQVSGEEEKTLVGSAGLVGQTSLQIRKCFSSAPIKQEDLLGSPRPSLVLYSNACDPNP